MKGDGKLANNNYEPWQEICYQEMGQAGGWVWDEERVLNQGCGQG